MAKPEAVIFSTWSLHPKDFQIPGAVRTDSAGGPVLSDTMHSAVEGLCVGEAEGICSSPFRSYASGKAQKRLLGRIV